MQPPDGPPVCTALIGWPYRPPPPTAWTKLPSGVPSGISTSPVFLTLPTREKTLVPELAPPPVSENHAGPRAMIGAILNHVSTLLILVG